MKRLVALITFALILTCLSLTAQAQTFNSGSTGVDGAFAPTTSTQVQIPESGVFNFTTINIPSSVEIVFKRNLKNTPVILLASGNVNILGRINIAGGNGNTVNAVVSTGGVGGPGGFDGGRGGVLIAGFIPGAAGSGPGGGGGGGSSNGSNIGGGGGGGFANSGSDGVQQNSNAVLGKGGQSYGSRTLLPLIGGSGGGGGGSRSDGQQGGAGGGGGGAILIASSGTITFGSGGNAGTVWSFGGTGGCVGSGSGGGGSGGAIRLVATTITGLGSLDVRGGGGAGCGNAPGGNGSHGYIRVEAYNYSSFQATLPVDTSPGNPTLSFGSPSTVDPGSSAPQLRIVSVAGVSAPASPNGSFSSPPDIIVPTAQANPVTVALQGSNVPTGTVASVNVLPETGPYTTVQSTPLSGTTASSTATASVSLPTGTSVITATVVIDLTAPSGSAKNIIINGERVDRIEVAAVFGGPSELTYITHSGKRIKKTLE